MASNCYIYKIINTVNSKVYIGKAADMALRWQQHQREARVNKKRHLPLYRDMHDFGIDKFSIEQLEVCAYDHTHSSREEYWIEYYDSAYPNGYNIEVPGRSKAYKLYPELRGEKPIQSPEVKAELQRKNNVAFLGHFDFNRLETDTLEQLIQIIKNANKH